MLNKRFGLILLVMAIILTTSCKKEFTKIGINLIDEPKFEGKLFDNAIVRVYDEAVPKVFTMASNTIKESNLPVTSLGIYNDDKFGTVEADVVTTIRHDIKLLQDLGDNTKILGAQLVVPYFSHTDMVAGEKAFVLDSVFGTHRFEIKIYELTYLLPTYDPNNNLETPQYYYSDFDFSPFKGDVVGDTIDFNVSTQPYITYKRKEDGTFELDDDGHKIKKDSLGPHMVIKLDTTYFRHKIFDHSGEDVLTDKEHFKDYFRGLYIDAVSDNGEGLMMQLPLDKAKMLIQYTYDETDDNDTPNDTSDDTVKTIFKEIKLPLSGTRVNHYDNTLTSYAQNALNNSDLINGDPDVVLKGEAGSQAVIQLFDEQQLRELRQNNWMINDAELYFYVNQDETDEMAEQAKRLILYNYDKQKSLEDIYSPENSEKNDYKVFNGKLEKDDDGNAYYKFGITRHIRNIINKDSTNVKLGLRVCSLISTLKTKQLFRDPDAYNPKGAILYGNQTATTPKKPVLKIYYTEPK